MRHRSRPWMQIHGSRPFRNLLGRIHSTHFLRLLLMGLLVSCVCFAASDPAEQTADSADQKDDISVLAALDTFGRLARAGRIDKVSVRYARWEVQHSFRISERDLMASDYPLDWEIIAYRKMATEVAVKLADALDKCQLDRKDVAASELDFGLGAVFCVGGKQVLSIGVSKYPPAISVNGELFCASPYIVYPLTTLMPLDAHRGMFFYTIDEWAYPPYKEMIGGFRRKGPKDEHVDLDVLVDRIKRGEAVRKER